MSELASEPMLWSLREAPAERSEAVRCSELASEPMLWSLREAPAERSEAVR